MSEHAKGPMLVIDDLVYTLDATDTCNRVTIQVQGGYANHGTGERTRLEECYATAQRLADCYNALEGINPQSVPALLEALEDAELFVELVRIHWKNLGDIEQASEAEDCLTKARAAIAAAKGGE